MRDPEFILLRNRFLVAVGVALVFAIPTLLFVVKSFGREVTDVLKGLNEKEDMLIYVESNDCIGCLEVKQILEDKNVDYMVLNIDKNTDYEEIIRKIGISKKVVEVPSLIYVEDGDMVANFMGIKTQDDVLSFLEVHNINTTRQ